MKIQMRARWTLTPCVYIHGTNAPFRQERVHLVLSLYTSLGVGFCISSFDFQGPLIPQCTKDGWYRTPTPFSLIDNEIHQPSAWGVGRART